MPSLADVANDLKGLLGDIKNNTAAANGLLTTLVSVDQTGFANLSSGIAVMIDRQQEANALLDEMRQQNDTVICWLTNMANVLCEQLHLMEVQVTLQRSIDGHVRRLEEIERLVHAREFVDVLDHEATQARLDECCPPPRPEPKPCFEVCPSPKYNRYHHSDATFQPLPAPKKG